MNPRFLLLTDLSPAARRAAHFAGLLAAGMGGELVLMYLEPEPLLEPEVGLVTLPEEYYTRLRLDTEAAMGELARLLPVPTTVVNGGGSVHNLLHEQIERWRPQLVVMALAPEQDVVDVLLANQYLPMLRETGLPLLLVPDGAAQDPGLPKLVAVAADEADFLLSPAALALEPLLKSWPATFCVVHVEPADAPGKEGFGRAVEHVRQSGLLPTSHWVTYEIPHESRSAGIVQAALDVQADVLVLLAHPRSFVGSVLGLGVVSEVARNCPVPLLVLPTLEPRPLEPEQHAPHSQRQPK